MYSLIFLLLCHPNVIPRENAPVESTIDGYAEYNVFEFEDKSTIPQLIIWQWDNFYGRHFVTYFYICRNNSFYTIKKEKGVTVIFYDTIIKRERRINVLWYKSSATNYDVELRDRDFFRKDARPKLSVTETSKSDWRYPPLPPPLPEKEHFFGFAKYEYILSR